MGEFHLPFPGRELADRELTYDLCYRRIPEEDRESIVEHAWQKGCQAAKMVFDEQKGSTDFFSIVKNSGLKLEEKDIDYVAGQQRYFSDYVSGRKTVTLYLKSIALWAEENEMELHAAENLILSHEYYHFLEITRLGLTSRDYQVPMLILGPIKIGKTGVRALSEIGAHAFARTYFELAHEEESYGTEPGV